MADEYKQVTRHGKIWEVPKEWNDDQIKEYVDRRRKEDEPAKPVKTEKKPPVPAGMARRIDDFIRSVAHGGTFGFSDEIAAAGDATFGGPLGLYDDKNLDWNQRYDMSLKEQRRKDREYAERSPFWSTAGNVVGGLGTMVPGGALLHGIGRGARIANATKALPRYGMVPATGRGIKSVAKGAGAGAAVGALTGFGEGEGGLEGRIPAAGAGALGGATVGALLPPVLASTARGVRSAGRAMAPATARAVEASQHAIARALARSGKTIEDIRTQLASAQDLGARKALVEAAPEFRDLGVAAAGQPGAARGILTNYLGERLRTAGDRMRGMASKAIGGNRDDWNTALREQDKIYKNASWVAFENAFAKDKTKFNNKTFVENLSKLPDGIAQKADKEAASLAQLEGRPYASVFTDGGKMRGPQDLRNFHYFHEGLQNTAASLENRNPTLASALDDVATDLQKYVAKNNREYRDALKLNRGTRANMKAVEMGRRSLSMDVDQFNNAVSNMSDAEKNFFKTGFLGALRDQHGRMVESADRSARMLVPSLQDKLKTLSVTPESFDKMMQGLRIEGTGAETALTIGKVPMANPKVVAGSEFPDTENINMVPALVEMLISPNLRTAIRAGRTSNILNRVYSMTGAASGMHPDKAAQVATRLVEENPDLAARILSEAQTVALDKSLGVSGRSAMSRIAAGPVEQMVIAPSETTSDQSEGPDRSASIEGLTVIPVEKEPEEKADGGYVDEIGSLARRLAR